MRVALADDSVLFRHGLAMLLIAVGVEVTAQASDGVELLRQVAADPPDVAVLDIRMPPTFTDEGLVTAEQLRSRHPGVGVLILSTYAEATYAVRLLHKGRTGLGYLLKDRIDDTDVLRDALSRVAAGESVIAPEVVARLLAHRRGADDLGRLTERERDVLRLIAEGRSNVGLSQQLRVSVKTVERHVASVFGKLELYPAPDDNRRVLAVLTWLRATGRGPDE